MTEKDPLADLTWPKPPEPSSAVSQRICHNCTSNLKAGTCASGRRRALLSLLVPTLVSGSLAWLAARHRVSDGLLRSGLYGAVGWAVVLSVVLVVGLARPPGRRPAAAVRLVLAVVVPIVFLGYLAATASAQVPFETFSQGAQASHALRCGISCLLVGAIVSGGVLLLWRGTDPLSPGVSGALAGLVGGLGTALAMGIACPSHEAWHLEMSHGLVVVALVALGGAVGRRLLTP